MLRFGFELGLRLGLGLGPFVHFRADGIRHYACGIRHRALGIRFAVRFTTWIRAKASARARAKAGARARLGLRPGLRPERVLVLVLRLGCLHGCSSDALDGP